MPLNYPTRQNLSYKEFISIVKSIHSCCAFVDGKYKEITDDIRDKMKAGELLIIEYHDNPLGEVIYLSASSNLQ